jgi:hypothetical protein
VRQPSSKPNAAMLEVQRKAALIARVFKTPDGQEALKILVKEFGGSCYAKGDPHHTAYLEGARDVLLYIQQMTNYTERGHDG